VDAQAITDIDITAAEALRGLNKELQQQGIALKFAHANRPLRKVLERIGFTSEIGRESIFHAVHEAAEAFQAEQTQNRKNHLASAAGKQDEYLKI
jgi:SulP family sulfate permease